MLVSFRGQTRFRMLAFPGQVLDGGLERLVDKEGNAVTTQPHFKLEENLECRQFNSKKNERMKAPLLLPANTSSVSAAPGSGAAQRVPTNVASNVRRRAYFTAPGQNAPAVHSRRAREHLWLDMATPGQPQR